MFTITDVLYAVITIIRIYYYIHLKELLFTYNSNFVTHNLRNSGGENTLKFLTYKKMYFTKFLIIIIIYLDTKILVPR